MIPSFRHGLKMLVVNYQQFIFTPFYWLRGWQTFAVAMLSEVRIIANVSYTHLYSFTI